jgi:hypothetical protein
MERVPKFNTPAPPTESLLLPPKTVSELMLTVAPALTRRICTASLPLTVMPSPPSIVRLLSMMSVLSNVMGLTGGIAKMMVSPGEAAKTASRSEQLAASQTRSFVSAVVFTVSVFAAVPLARRPITGRTSTANRITRQATFVTLCPLRAGAGHARESRDESVLPGAARPLETVRRVSYGAAVRRAAVGGCCDFPLS